MEISFQDLRHKEVINVDDGRALGFVCDIVFDCSCGKLLGIVVPGERKIFSFRRRQEVFINYHHICKIGADVILVDICFNPNHHTTNSPNSNCIPTCRKN